MVEFDRDACLCAGIRVIIIAHKAWSDERPEEYNRSLEASAPDK